jgi:predicted N-acetyltransferase YhbS
MCIRDRYKEALELRIKVLRAPLGLVYTPEQLAEEATDIHVVAIDEGKVVGTILLRHINEQVIKMRQFAVAPDRQRQGIGSEIVAYCEDYALENGYNTIELHARESAVPFYQPLEYEKVGERFTEVTIPHFKMVKHLSDED